MMICFCLFFPDFTFSQGQWNNWIFGQHAGINFNSGIPVPITNVSPLYNSRGSGVTISDSLGNLLFYAENNLFTYEYIYNRNNDRMPNGDLYVGNDYNNPQPLFAVQNLVDDSSYFIFSVINPNPPGPGGLVYSVLDMRLDGGLGDISSGQKSIPILGGSHARSLLTGTRHHNNKDAWIVVHNLTGTNSYLAFLVNSLGIDTTPVISPSFLSITDSTWIQLVTLKISPDGTKLICLGDTTAEYCAFNSTTGAITHLFNIHFTNYTPGQVFGPDDAEFSVDNKYLYITEGGDCSYGLTNLYQFDATKTDSLQFKQSQVLISSESCVWNQFFDALQRGPDYKIYCLDMFMVDSVSVINHPSVQGSGCDFQTNVLCLLSGNLATYRLPQFLQKYYLYIHHSFPLCSKDSISFNSSIWPPADSIQWDFGDPGSGSSNYSNLPKPYHVYSTPGTYTAELFVRHVDKRTDTAWQTITIFARPTVSLGIDRTICVGDSTTFDAGFCSGCTYHWTDLGTGLGVGNSQTFKTSLPGAYMVSVTSSDSCSATYTIQLFTTPVPVITNNPFSKSICSGESTNIVLSSNISGTTFHWTASLTSGNVTGFSADSGLIINQVLINTLSTSGVVIYHITPVVGSCTGLTVDFTVTVNPGDSVSVSISTPSNNVCEGTQVTYNAMPVNEGSSPSYQWKVNGIDVGPSSPTYSYIPVNGDIVTCILTSSNTVCVTNNPAISNAITMTVNPILPVSVSIAASTNPFCEGINCYFTLQRHHEWWHYTLLPMESERDKCRPQ